MSFFKNRKFTLFFFILFFFLFFTNSFAASLKFDPSTLSANTGKNFDIKIVVDAGSEKIITSDAYVTYDSNLLDVSAVNDAGFFQGIQKNFANPGRLYVGGFINDSGVTRTGTGNVATVTFKPKSPGTATLSFDCTQGSTTDSNIGKGDVHVSDIITCSENGQLTVNIGGTSTGTTITPTRAAGTSTGTTSTSSSGTYVNPTALPNLGAFEDTLKYSIPGSILLFIGSLILFL